MKKKAKKRPILSKTKQTKRKLFTAQNGAAKLQKDSSEDENEEVSFRDTSDSSEDFEENDMNSHNTTATASLQLEVGNFVVVKFAGKKDVTHYVGQIVKIDEDRITTNFMHRSDMRRTSFMTFSFPEHKDEDSHDPEDVVLRLPLPMKYGKTSRCAEKHVFSVDLATFEQQPQTNLLSLKHETRFLKVENHS